ncbi:MAG TPA: hypothetical protein VFI29_11815 [Hanamia sp.]|nr:hypothetical protein [Hanamia sp.]
MDVHHHPDLHHQKKNYKEYFLEFMMIFLAVTLGFFAEGLRENISNHHREKQYMRSMVDDLKKDTATISGAIPESENIARGLDSLKNVLYQDFDKINVAELYRLQLTYGIRIGFSFSDQATSQLKAGGLNMIKSQEVVNAISNYWSRKDFIKSAIANITDKQERASEIIYQIFNYKYVHDFHPDSSNHLIVSIDPKSRLMISEPALLVNFANRLTYIVSILKGPYLAGLQKQYKAAVDLISLIKKKYNLKDE